MVDVDAAGRVRNAQAPWNDFSSQDYWRHNYQTVHPEDREIIERVSHFFASKFEGRERASRAIDVGSGSNLYPALLMLPWTEQILLTDYSERNVSWLTEQVKPGTGAWDWLPFWRELAQQPGYHQLTEPRKLLAAACAAEPGVAGIERHSVFELPSNRWQLGTMFFVAESITQDYSEFQAAVSGFVNALQAGAPFAVSFMAGSQGYTVGQTSFPALRISTEDVSECFTELGARDLNIYLNRTAERVRPGYEGMIVATGVVGS
jgi:hypothetical protein